MPFSSLGLSPALARAAQALGFTAPTPVQAAAVPALLRGADVLVTAQTGSGKTAAYALPLLQRYQDSSLDLQQRGTGSRHTAALVVVPTRELAAQVAEVLRSLGQALSRPPKIAVLFGGVSINPQMMGLRGGADIVVATPGRLLDIVDHNALKLSAVQTLVLDEADRLLDLGFADELQRVLDLLPTKRQTLLCSATFPAEIEQLGQRWLHQPERIAIESDEPEHATTIMQRAIAVDTSRRTQLLRHLVQKESWERVLVFVATKYAAEIVAEKLYKAGIFATSFHGDLSQGARQQVLQEFKDERWQVVVTTDLAARGIDIAQLPVVVNYDLPRSAVDYVHRIGRTGRAGESGQALSFVSASTEAHWRLIEKRQGMTLPREVIEGFEPLETADITAPADVVDGAPLASSAPRPAAGKRDPNAPENGGVKGKRPSKKDKLRAQQAGGAGH